MDTFLFFIICGPNCDGNQITKGLWIMPQSFLPFPFRTIQHAFASLPSTLVLMMTPLNHCTGLEQIPTWMRKLGERPSSDVCSALIPRWSLMATADPEFTATTVTELVPTADPVPELMPAMNLEPEPMPATKPEPAASSVSESKPATQSDQVCEPVARWRFSGARWQLSSSTDPSQYHVYFVTQLKVFFLPAGSAQLWVFFTATCFVTQHQAYFIAKSWQYYYYY